MRLSLRAMRYTRTAILRSSIAAAAEELNVAASAVSAAIDQAEEAFGITLVTRARAKGISPTSAGRVILRRMEDLLDRYDAMLIDGAEMRTSLSGVLKIGYYAPVAPAFLPKILAPMLSENPSLSLFLEECDNARAQSGLLDGRYDVILFVADSPVPQIVVERLIHAPTYCLCSSEHRFARQTSVRLLDLVDEPLIILDRPVAKAHYLDLLESSGKPISVVATVNSTEMIRALVGSGLGCSILNMRPVSSSTYAGDNTACLPIEESSIGLTLSLGHVPGPRRRVVQAFSEACKIFFSAPEGRAMIIGV
ncbi:DNA-binding transcriptional regulator, LysR family [Paracoccus alcaliphilus]|uniref:DNA-binding transcriptional regulator, LysR family n=1 Tax=Paracoccus alcaliphilus TaxID=34002 RepID=A0A1H8MME9_9RHOB|nr:LysR family transcriptional regulator [Paracoccus alcaliphilus]WCR21103.1 LysR family transcriptional regulator [Paracoccus alcaliphilus]SEO18418.1 DNA-binding transcriptional regulator, LysR family [Paracoccus alcaliphilus]